MPRSPQPKFQDGRLGPLLRLIHRFNESGFGRRLDLPRALDQLKQIDTTDLGEPRQKPNWHHALAALGFIFTIGICEDTEQFGHDRLSTVAARFDDAQAELFASLSFSQFFVVI